MGGSAVARTGLLPRIVCALLCSYQRYLNESAVTIFFFPRPMLWYPGQNEKLVVSCSFRGSLGGSYIGQLPFQYNTQAGELVDFLCQSLCLR
jgi:hypothetical protein